MAAGKVKLGMHVLQVDGSVGVITGWKIVPGTQVMYNLEVAQDHTFTVGVGQWVVHNECSPGRLRRALNAAHPDRPGQPGQNPHHVLPCALMGANASPEARAIVQQAGGWDFLNSAANGRWLWSWENPDIAMQNAEPWHANNPTYQQFADRLLRGEYPQVANGSISALEAATNVIGTLNVWISAVGMQSAMMGEPCSLSGFDFGL